MKPITKTIFALQLEPGLYFTGWVRDDPEHGTVYHWGQTEDMYRAGDYGHHSVRRQIIEYVKEYYDKPKFVKVSITAFVVGDL